MTLASETSHLDRDHPVADLIASRRATGSKPGPRDDNAKLALVIEGGGMRGVVAGGMVTALEDAGLHDVFDVVIGASAGALAGAYFLGRGARVGTSIYYEDLIGPEWITFKRLLSKSSVVGFDYLFDELICRDKPLDCDRIRRSDIPLHVVATRVPDYQRKILSRFETDADLVSALRASARLPLIGGKPESLSCGEYFDGSLTEAIPINAAKELGATHMLVLLTRPQGQRRRDPGRLQRRIAFPAMNLMQRGLGDICAERAARYDRELLTLQEWQAPGVTPAALAIQLPPQLETIGLLEQDPAILEAGAAAGAEAVRQALSLTGIERIPELVAG